MVKARKLLRNGFIGNFGVKYFPLPNEFRQFPLTDRFLLAATVLSLVPIGEKIKNRNIGKANAAVVSFVQTCGIMLKAKSSDSREKATTTK